MIALTDEFLIKINGGEKLHECEPYQGPDPDGIDEIIPICYYGRSGTVFFSSLLDGHPEIIKTGNFDFREYFKYFYLIIGLCSVEKQLSNAIRHYGRNMEYPGKFNQNFVEIKGKLIHVPATLEFSNEAPADRRLAFIIAKDGDELFYQGPYIGYFIFTFLNMANHYYGHRDEIGLGEREFFTVFNLAYNWVIGRRYDKTVSKLAWNMHMPDPILAKNAQKFYPKITLIHMIRKPMQTLGSHFKRYMYPTELEVKNDIQAHDYVNKLFSELMQGDTPLIEPRANDDEFAVRLEDIHSKPENTLLRLCERMGISWSETLLDSTYFGFSMVWSQSSQRGVMSGFSTKHLQDDHPDIFTEEDIKLIEAVLYENYARWDYKLQHELNGEDRAIYLKTRLPLPLKMELMCWQKACEQGATRMDILHSYNGLRDAIEQRMARRQALLELM